MALDVNKFNDLVNQKVAEKQQPPEEEKSIFEQIGEVVTNQSDINRQVAQESTEIAQDALQTAGQGIDLVVNTASDINNAYHNFLDEQRNITGAYTTANINQANETGDYSFQNQAVENLQQAGQELIYSPLKQVSRAIVNRYSDDNESILQDVTQGIQESNAYVNYMMTDEEKLQKAIEIENETGIKAKEFLSDTTAYREAIEIYNYAKKKKELGGDMNDVFDEFPELKNIASMDAQSAALALHDINSVRETQGVIDSFNKMWEYGNKHLEYSNLNYKLMTGQATEEDKARIDELKKQLEQAPNLPAFLDNPFAVIAGGVAGSMPMMIQSMGEMIDDFAIGASAGMVAGALAGSALPGAGTVGGGLVGAVGGGIANTIRANAIRQGAMQGARLTGGYLARYGMFAGMAKPATGGYYAEFKDLKGEDGKPLLSDEAAQDYAVVAGALNAGIEMLDFGLIKDAFTGNVAKQTVKEIIATAQKQALAKEGIKSFFTNRASAIAKVSMAESGEEGLQSVSDDLVHNQIMQDTGDTTNRVYTATEIAQRALMSAGEALPGAIGFGVISAGVGGFNESLGFSRNLKRLMSNNAKLEQSTRQTFAGTLMLERLQSAVRNSKLKKTAPKVQERLLRSQLDNTGFEMAYVDIPTALESQTGKQDLETLTKTAGYTQEDLKTAIEIGGTLAIPTAKFAQAETTSDIMRAVTFNQEADPIGKLRKNAETITNEMQDSIQKTADKQRMLIDAIMQEQFANGTKEQQTMAQAVIYNNVSNPAKGWKQVHDDQINERNNILVPAIDAIKKSIEQNDTWYQEFYAKHNRAMTDKEIEDMAYKLTVGDETAPSIPTWQATTPEAVQALAENKNILDDIDNNLKVLDEIKPQLSNLNGVEMRLAEGLTKDGYAVYNRLSKQLQNAGGKVKRASRMSAILFARHADIVADIMRRHGNENYTAMTYYNERFALNTVKGKGTYKQFAGEKALNKNIEQLKIAKQLDAEGEYTDEVIWQYTGWVKGKDNKWRFEIPDDTKLFDMKPLEKINNITLANSFNETNSISLDKIYKNEELYEAYPQLRDVLVLKEKSKSIEHQASARDVDINGKKLSVIVINDRLNVDTDKMKINIVHEIQHLIQKIEGFAGGGNLNSKQEILDQLYDEVLKEIKAYNSAFWKSKAQSENLRKEGTSELEALKNADLEKFEKAKLYWDLQKIDDIEVYMNLGGEQEARETANRVGRGDYNLLNKPTIHDENAIVSSDGKVIITAKKEAPKLTNKEVNIIQETAEKVEEKNKKVVQKKVQKIKNETTANIKGDITLLSNGQRVINLYKSADESTFVHEMAHMFLMDLDELAKIDELSKKELDIVNDWASWKNEKSIDEYKNAPWYKEFKARHESIINAKNAGDVAKVEELKEAWRQERFARAFELYLQKGTAPSKGLKDVFRKFKKFLRDIYIGFTSIGGVASPKVEAIMQRMVATEEEINQMALDDRYRDITKAGGEKLLDETEEQTYKRWHKEAIEEAKEHLMKIVMQDLKAEAKAKFDERVEKERAYKLNELENQPVYIAQEAYKEAGDINIVLNWFGSVEEYKQALKNTKPIQTALDEYMKQYEKTLDTELMESHLSEENILQAMEDSKYTSKLVAMETRIFKEKVKLINKIGSKTQVAMQDVEDKLNALDDYTDLKVDKEDARVKSVMNALNKLRFSTKWNAKDLGRIEAMFNSNTKETLAEAFKQFVEETKQQKINREAIEKAHEGKLKMFKEMAERALDGKTIFEACNVALYRKNESMHARRVKQAVKASNWERAMKEKEAQYISSAMAQKALKNKLYIQKKIEKVNKQLKVRSIKLPAQERYWHKHLAYILGITNKDANPPVDGITPLADLFKGLQDSLDLEYTPTDILEITSRSDFSGYQSMTIAQFEDAVEALDILYTTGRDKFKLKTIQGKSIDDAINEIILDDTAYNRSMVINKKINPDKGGIGYNDLVDKIPLIGDAMARGGAKYLSSMMKPEEIINILGTKAHKYLYETYERASNLEAEMMTKNVYKIKEILKDYSHSEKLSWKKQQYKLEFEDGTVENLSKENIICMALNLGNDINRSRLAVGFGLTEEYLKEFVEKHMTKKDWQMVQDIWNHLHSFWKDTVRVEQELNGVTLKPQQPTPFDVKLPDGEILHLEGGYYPIVANPLKSNRVNEQEVNEAVRRTMSGAQVLGTGRGFTKARSQANIDRALLLEFSVIPDHLSNVIHNITHRIPARDVYRLVKNKQFEEYVNRTMGKEIYQVLDEWAVDNWRVIPEASNNKTVQKVSKMLSYLRTNSTLAIMGYRLYPIIENMTNIAPMMDKLGAMKSLVAIADYYTNISKYQEVLHKSIFMKNRLNHMDRDIKYIPGLFDEDRLVTGFLKEHAYTLMTYSDLMFSAPLWCRSYKDAYAKKLDEVKKENEANVEKLQNAQAKVSTIRARIMDLQQNALKSNFDVQGTNINQVGDFQTFVNTREELNQLQKDLYMAEVELDNASELRFLTDKEILAEAESRSIAEADKSIREVFGSGQTKDLASIQKGGELLKLFTPFYTFFNTQANAILQAYYKGKFMKPTTMGENITRWLPVARSFLYRIVLTSALSTMLRMALLGDGSDDKHKYEKVKNAEGTEEKIEIPAMQRFLTQFGKNTLSTMAGTMWGVRDIASFFINESFEGTDYGRGIGFSNVALAGGEKITALYKLLDKKAEKDLEIADKEAKWQTEYMKAGAKKRKTMLEDKQYQKPPKRITYADIAKASGEIGTTFFAARTGITSTMANSVFTTMQYIADGDGRYDTNLKNIIWSALFNKKPVERVIPEKPKQPKKKGKSKNVRRY
ncbi:MAG: large polyvalent protein associated domain 23 protein [Bacteriophage sp.]|nr:MAG: large polyvalent protein associated domain 23 protein [Bacteriophage sp.]